MAADGEPMLLLAEDERRGEGRSLCELMISHPTQPGAKSGKM
jgi:hypothetical protein